MIPRIIHYCWFGGKELPEQAIMCIESWRKYCPGYIIKEWNESNFDLNACDYVREAYQEKKWAFVSDYARFKLLYEYGGVYFDTDVELIASIDDIIDNGPFFGMEGKRVAAGLGMASDPGHRVYKEILDLYEGIHYEVEKAAANSNNVVTFTTDILRKKGFVGGDKIECVDGIWIYPPEYFNPMEFKTGCITLTKNTRSIHHYAASWFSDKEKKRLELQRKLAEKYPGIDWLKVYSSRVWKIGMNLYVYGFTKTLNKIMKIFSNV